MSTRVNSFLRFGKAALLVAVMASAVAVSIRTGSAKTSQTTATRNPTRFAAASVRPGDGRRPLNCRGIDGELSSAWLIFPRPPKAALGRCTANDSLFYIVLTAYSSSANLYSWRPNVVGFPFDWSLSYQIEAVAENPGQATKGELRQMLQALLEDRFKARVHAETKQADGYVLTVAKGGIKFRENPEAQDGLPVLGPVSLRDPIGPNIVVPSRVQGSFTITRFASYFLPDELGMPVIDKTNLPGIYDITLKVDVLQLRGPVEGGQGGRSSPGQRLNYEFNPPLPRALEEQLGLHLERAKVQVETLVIDHLEKATEN